MGGLEVHEHQLFPVFSDGSHPVGVHADPVHTCQEVLGDGDRIEVEGNDVRRLLPLEHCVGFPRRGRDDAAE
jgi:hypothetical protein